MTKKGRILGIDPGSRVTGYGIVDAQGSTLHLVDFGCIRPPASLSIPQRYRIIYEGVLALIEQHEPEALSVETQFFPRESPNINSLLKLGMVRGIIVLAAAQKELELHEYSPASVKKAVCSGRATKEQVQSMVQRLLSMTEIPQPADAADALALAICHAHNRRFNQRLGASHVRLCKR